MYGVTTHCVFTLHLVVKVALLGDDSCCGDAKWQGNVCRLQKEEDHSVQPTVQVGCIGSEDVTVYGSLQELGTLSLAVQLKFEVTTARAFSASLCTLPGTHVPV